MHAYTAVIERCPDTQLYVGYVPGFPGAHSQAATLDELHANLGSQVGCAYSTGEGVKVGVLRFAEHTPYSQHVGCACAPAKAANLEKAEGKAPA